MDYKVVAIAIAHAEGYFVNGSIPQHANNPGDMELGDVGYGTLGEGITVFANTDDGWDALYHQVQGMLDGRSHIYTQDMTLAQVAIKYSGDPNWSKNVAAALGVSESITLAELAKV